jgi:putative FmdB family regulatory protein
MPIYEYICLECGHQFEALRTMKDADAPIKCELCSAERSQRALSVFNAMSSSGSVTKTQPSCGPCAGGNCGCCH